MSKKGLLLGSILADAFVLGGHWIYDSNKIKENFGDYNELHDPLPESFHKNRRKGEHTHYGDQTLLLLESMAEEGCFDKKSFQNLWLEKMEKYDGYVDHATKDSIVAIKKGQEWGSTSSDLAGASRIAPIIYCNTDKKKGITDAITQTKVTHNNEEVCVVAEFFVRVAYYVLDGFTPTESIKKVDEDMKNNIVDNAICKAYNNLNLPSEDAIKKMGQACNVDGAFPATIYLILKYEDDYRKAMKANVMAGGDSAARGLLVGMIIGAYKEETIPKEWLKEMSSLKRVNF